MTSYFRLLFCFFILTCSCLLAKGQENNLPSSTKVIQLSGQIKFEDYETPIEGVHIYIKNKDIGTISNYRGVFTLAMNTEDTVVFKALGLKTIEKTITTTSITHNFEYMEVIMEQDTFYLNPVYISPLPEGLAFDYHFSQLEEYSPANVHKKSLNPQAIQKMAEQLPYQNIEIQIHTQRDLHRQRGWDGLRPSGSLLKKRF